MAAAARARRVMAERDNYLSMRLRESRVAREDVLRRHRPELLVRHFAVGRFGHQQILFFVTFCHRVPNEPLAKVSQMDDPRKEPPPTVPADAWLSPPQPGCSAATGNRC